MSDSKPLPLILVVGAQNWIWYKSKCNRSILFLNFAQIQPINILDNFWHNHFLWAVSLNMECCEMLQYELSQFKANIAVKNQSPSKFVKEYYQLHFN